MHSFVSSSFARKNSLCVTNLPHALCIATPVRVVRTVNRLALAYSILIEGWEFFADLHLMELGDYDVILSMDWLSLVYAAVDCHRKKVHFCFPD